MNYAVIENGDVINVIVLNNPDLADMFHAVPLEEGYGIGDFNSDDVWTKAPAPEPEPELIPEINLDELKSLRYKQAAQNLDNFLLNNPLKFSCHGGKEAYYDVMPIYKASLQTAFLLM